MSGEESRDVWNLIGVSDDDLRVYRRMVSDLGADARTHADALGYPCEQLIDALARLAKLGLLRRNADAPSGYEPVEPRIGLGALLRERRGDLDRIEATSHELSRTFAAGLLRTEPQRLFDVVEGRDSIEARIHDLLRMARYEAVGIDTPPYVAAGSAQVSDAELGLLRRGVRFRSLYASEVLDEPALVARIHWMAERGEQSRVLPQVPMKLLIVDAEAAVVLLSGEERGQQALSVVAGRSAFTRGLQAMFDQLWMHASAIRIGASGDDAQQRPDADTVGLIDLLAAGMKDDSIARHLGVSARTLRRRVAMLLDGLDSTGRFQAGVRAAQRGWI